MPFKIATVCQHCQLARDLDLCKDPGLLLARSETKDSVWPCPACRHPIDKTIVEGKLIDILQRQIASYAMQDLRCQRCNQVKASNMALHCECSGAYKLETNPSDHWKKVRTVQQLADYYGLDMVLEMANDCLRYR